MAQLHKEAGHHLEHDLQAKIVSYNPAEECQKTEMLTLMNNRHTCTSSVIDSQ